MFNTGNKVLERWSTLASVLVVGVVAFWGGFARRWISDDGLIVLRTVRNLEAGNGPVFNVGERVEANTSTLWQYLILVVRWISSVELESIAIYLGLFLAVAGMVVGTWASVTMHSGIVLPAGALVYVAVPPARDFFTSGLEWGLCLFYLAVLWWMLTIWARPRRHARSDSIVYWLAFWAGLSWLIRPELALYGGLVGVVLIVTTRSWKVIAVAVPLPLGYEIFRMGYYGLLTPHTAVAKSAADSEWGKGFAYVGDFVGPYALFLPLIVLAGAALWKADMRSSALRSMPTVVYLFLGTALLHTLYVLRVGGDFMHGRMLLLPLFAALLPIFVVNLRAWWAAAFCAVWAFIIVLRGHPVDQSVYEGEISVVDERDFWTYTTNRQEPPRTAKDFLGMDIMDDYGKAVRDLQYGDAMTFRYIKDGGQPSWMTAPRDPERSDTPTIYLVNLGLTSMNAPLDVRVLDDIGLSNPLAARQPRIEGGRIGHDKNLDIAWQVADSAVDIDSIPPWLDKDAAREARAALADADFQKLFDSYRKPLTWNRFWENIKFSLTEGRALTFSSNPQDYLG
ncbi:hypothetical protein GWO54_07650 [Corynebacterium macginleyi]|uniref:hypothetical protein n=1 Tax=Corynebacterium macginleyi TaxID=38290 RepID=UPI00190994D6|nr:hypothetical protein [Corynebacterium macginleyi]MBK4142398.1 hypothetical protein [Corynebacterium macginleyi]